MCCGHGKDCYVCRAQGLLGFFQDVAESWAVPNRLSDTVNADKMLTQQVEMGC